MVDIDRDRLAASAAGLSGAPHLIAADLGDWAECERVVAEAVARFGRLDILVNCAAVLRRIDFDEVDAATSYAATFDINARARVFCALPRVRPWDAWSATATGASSTSPRWVCTSAATA